MESDAAFLSLFFFSFSADEIGAREARLEALKGDGERLKATNNKVLGLIKSNPELKAEAAGRKQWEKQAKDAEKKAAEDLDAVHAIADPREAWREVVVRLLG